MSKSLGIFLGHLGHRRLVIVASPERLIEALPDGNLDINVKRLAYISGTDDYAPIVIKTVVKKDDGVAHETISVSLANETTYTMEKFRWTGKEFLVYLTKHNQSSKTSVWVRLTELKKNLKQKVS